MPENQAGAPPRQVVLFSGHMIDAPGRKESRFPPDKEDIAAREIARALNELGTGAQDLAIYGGACGGDLLFAEACAKRGMRLELYLPFDEKTFLAKSVDFADEHPARPGRSTWHDRFFAMKAKSTLHIATVELGSLPSGEDPYERNNLWMLEAAMRYGADKAAFIALWNGQGGDGPGGTKHLMDEVRSKSNRVIWIDTTQLWH